MEPKKMQVEILTGIVLGPGRDGLPGDIVALDELQAKQLIALHNARAVEDKKTKGASHDK